MSNYYKDQDNLVMLILDRVDTLRSWLPSWTPERQSLDITLTHSQLSPEQLERLLSFDDGSFGHDVFGIHKRRWWQGDGDDWIPRCK